MAKQWYTSSVGKRSPQYKSPKHKSPKRKSPKHKSPKRKSPKHKGPGTPETPARELTSGTKRKGRDGLFYKVMIRSNGVNYWQKCGAKADGGSYCRFVGPARK